MLLLHPAFPMTRRGARLATLAFLAGTLLTACGGGGSGGTPASTGPATASMCADGGHAAAGSYVVENNTWNKGTAINYRQCLGIATAQAGGEGVDAVWEWTWPEPATGVRAYPEIIFGRKPWNDSTTDKLPRIVDQVAGVRADFAYTSTHTGAGNLAFDIWLTSSNVKVGDHLPLKHELMIWVDTFGMTPAGVQADTVTVNGVTWDLYATTATWGPEPFQYLAYLPRTAVPSPVSIDVRQFLDHLKARGSISGQEWLASVEFGNEVMAGSGSTRLSGFKVSVN